jgi:ethanolamine utilization protein EutN
MRIAEVIGRVTLSRWDPALTGARWLVAAPLSQSALQGQSEGRGEALVVYDELGAGRGSIIAVSEGVEAAVPFMPKQVPIDAYNAAILDHVEIYGG